MSSSGITPPASLTITFPVSQTKTHCPRSSVPGRKAGLETYASCRVPKKASGLNLQKYPEIPNHKIHKVDYHNKTCTLKCSPTALQCKRSPTVNHVSRYKAGDKVGAGAGGKLEPRKEGLLWDSHHNCSPASTSSSLFRARRDVVGEIFFCHLFPGIVTKSGIPSLTVSLQGSPV